MFSRIPRVRIYLLDLGFLFFGFRVCFRRLATQHLCSHLLLAFQTNKDDELEAAQGNLNRLAPFRFGKGNTFEAPHSGRVCLSYGGIE